MQSPTVPKRRGLFLAEMLIAMAIFVTAFVILLGVITSGSVALAQARDRVAANTVCEGILESVRSVYAPPNSLGAATAVTYNGNTGVTYATRGVNVVLEYTYTVTVTPQYIGGTQAWKDIHVSVSWVNSQRTRTVTMETAVGP